MRGAAALAAWLILVASSVELACQAAYRVKAGHWLATAQRHFHQVMFQRHPYLAVAGQAGIAYDDKGVKLKHNDTGYRGRPPREPRPPGVVRVVALGGSTTYCTHLSEHQAWPALLQEELGPGFEVLNMGVPGYSTVENLIQTALQLSDLRPDVAVYMEGWNDVRSSHVEGLKADYSDFHGPHLIAELNLAPLQRPTRWASLYFARYFLLPKDELPTPPKGGPKRLTAEPDERALALYRRNLKLISALCRAQGITPLFVPQRLNDSALTGEGGYWVPFVKDKDLPAIMRAYNAAMGEVAAAEKVRFAGDMLKQQFEAKDYADQGHFSEAGSRKVAKTLAAAIRKIRPSPMEMLESDRDVADRD